MIVFALSKWLGGVWAARILLREEARHQREFEALVRRRDVYSRLAKALCVYLRSHEDKPGQEERFRLKRSFLEAYDEASVWAPHTVMDAVGHLLDLVADSTAMPGSVQQPQLEKAYVRRISEMRKDAGFATTSFKYRVVSF